MKKSELKKLERDLKICKWLAWLVLLLVIINLSKRFSSRRKER